MAHSRHDRGGALAAWLFWLAALGARTARADGDAPDAAPQLYAIHAQATFVDQLHDAFHAPYSGPNSLASYADGRETFDATLFAGLRPWRGGELWFNPEIDQGYGLSNSLGIAGFSSGEAYKVGKSSPYVRVQRLFLRQTFDLSGKVEVVEPGANLLGASHAQNTLTVTVGKVSVTDIFDQNDLAHDPKHDVLNWALLDAGTFDYAADAWGYSVGAAVEWRQGAWTLRSGVFDLSDVPNSERLDTHVLDQFQVIEEVERRFSLAGQPGVVMLTGFLSRGRMGRFDDAIALADATGAAASTALVRHYRSREGASFNLRQQITKDLALFARGGLAGGDVEPFDFSDIDQTISGGLTLKGGRWGRTGDTVSLGGVVNGISDQHKRYFEAGGLGILVGDGKLPHPGAEDILETYYDVALVKAVHVAADYQFVANPGYNRDRGPVSIVAIRVHAQF